MLNEQVSQLYTVNQGMNEELITSLKSEAKMLSSEKQTNMFTEENYKQIIKELHEEKINFEKVNEEYKQKFVTLERKVAQQEGIMAKKAR